MQFVIIARDGTDADTPQKRLATRDSHLRNIEDNMPHMIMGAATLGEDGGMNGSVMMVDFPTRADLDDWLNAEPYVTHKVWQDVTVLPCKIGPAFTNRIKA